MADINIEDIEDIVTRDFINNPKAFQPGHRNDDTVDFMILCHCGGIDPWSTMRNIAQANRWSVSQATAVADHMKRVEPYLEEWGDHGTMEAMAYAINY